MNRSLVCAALSLAVLAVTFSLRAEGPAADTRPAPANSEFQTLNSEFKNPDSSRYLLEDQIKPGDKGYGLTVMHGGKIEKFQFEVIDVIKNLSPANNAILVRCSGLNLEHTGVIAGMSGSPCYLNDKMIGAIAFGWNYSKDPIAGVQPIRQMLSIPLDPTPAKKESAGGSRWSADIPFTQTALASPFGPLAKNLARRVRPSETPIANGPAQTDKRALGLQPLASPLMVGGASEATRAYLEGALKYTHLVPISGGSAGATPTTNPAENPLGGLADVKPGDIELAPGSSIAIPILTGDMDLSAIGTVTEVRDKTVYAFGHAMFAEGVSHLPISTGYIYTIMPNLQQSFKFGASYTPQGSLVVDEQTGIVGRIGAKPPTIPITLAIKSADGAVNRTYTYHLAPHPRLTPEILAAALTESITAQRGLPKTFTLHLTGTAAFEGAAGPTSVNLQLADTNQIFNPAMAVIPIALLADNPFENLTLKSVDFQVSIDTVNHSATIKSISVNRLVAAPGDKLTAIVEIEPWHSDIRKIPITLQIPDDAPEGEFSLSIGPASSALSDEISYAPNHFDPQDITALATDINRILAYRNDRLYATLVLDITGAAINGRERPNLPASRIALYASSKRTDASPIMRTVKTTLDAGCILLPGGDQSFSITIDKRANDRYYTPKHDDFGSGGPSSHPGKSPLTAPAPPAPHSGEPDN